jgi:hypothetical protein
VEERRAQWTWNAAATLVAAAALARLASVIGAQLPVAFDLAYETPTAAVIRLIQAGRTPYDPASYASPPFVMTVYTPLYPYLVAALPPVAGNPFLVGRVVSAVSLLLAASLLFAVHGRGRGWAVPALAFAAYFSFWPALIHTAYLKNDPTALLLSGLAVVCADRARGRTWAPYAAAALCVAALATKQSYGAASAACLGFFLARERRTGLRFALAWAGGIGAGAAAASWAWGDGFWFSAIRGNLSRLSLDIWVFNLARTLRQPLVWVILGIGAAAARAAWRRDGAALLRESPYPLYAVVSLALAVATVGRVGAAPIYFLEFFLALLFWIVHELRDRSLPGRSAAARLAAAALLAALLLDVAAPPRAESYIGGGMEAERSALRRAMRERIAGLGFERPRVLDFTTHLYLYDVEEDVVLNDPFYYRVLWESGVLDPAPLEREIRAGHFDVVLLPAGAGPASFGSRPLAALTRAVRRRYVLASRDAVHDYYVRQR